MVTILLLSVYLISTTELGQLLKFPILIEHYFHHKEKNPDISVFQFLEIHYAGNHLQNHPYDEDYEEDQKLPFILHTDLLNVSIVLSKVFFLELSSENYTFSKRITVHNDNFFSSFFISGIWQPPKFC